MKKFAKLWAVLLVAVMALSFTAGCGQKAPAGTDVSTEASTEAATVDTTQITINRPSW